MADKRYRNVLAVYSLRDKAARDSFSGVLDALSNKYDWHLTVIRPGRYFTPDELVNEDGEPYDGVILPLPGTDETMRRLATLKLPMALVNITDARLSATAPNIASIWLDNMEIGRRAADFLLRHGCFASAGYVHEPVSHFYSDERLTAFRRQMSQAGLVTEVFTPPADPIERQAALQVWLNGMPKPTAVMAVSDMRAADIISACRAAKITIPGQVAVIGVDNDIVQGQRCDTTITSIRPDFREMGRLAVRELGFLFAHPRRQARPHEILVPACEIVIGESTPHTANAAALVRKALDFIVANKRQRLTPADVVRHLGCSRQQAERRFAELRSSTLRKEIESVRMSEAQKLLNEGSSVRSVVRTLRFTSENQFYRIYRRHFKRTLTQARNAVL